MSQLCVVILLLVNIIWAQQASLTLLTDAVTKEGAMCLDGSPAAYYFLPGTGSGVTKWFIHHQGGGYCTSLGDCYSRSQGNLGSSKSYTPTIDLGGGYFSTNPQVNPLMYNWNMVFFPYCDGSFFQSNNETVSDYQGHKLFFRGYRNELAYYHHLAANRNLLKGTDFVIGGCSAGGLATFFHVDRWRELLPLTSTVRGLPDSGYILDYDGGKGPQLTADLKWIFATMNVTSGLNQDCVTAHQPTNDVFQCFLIEHTTQYIKTPIFPLQSQYDAWQVDNILGTRDATAVNNFGQLMESRFKAGVMWNPKNGCFFDSCFHHCGEWDSIIIDNTNSGNAFNTWYNGGKGDYFQDKVYPCNNCC